MENCSVRETWQGHRWRGGVGTRKIQDPAVRIADGCRNLLVGGYFHTSLLDRQHWWFLTQRERERELFARKDDLSGTRKWSKYSTWYMFIVGTGFLGDTWSVFSAQPQRQQTRISFVIIHLNQVLVSVQQPALHWDHGIGVGPVGSIVGWCHWMFCECTHSHLEDLLT